MRLETIERSDQADIAFGDEIGDRQTVALITPRDKGYEPQMTADKRLGRRAVAVFFPALSKPEFLLPLEYAEALDALQITFQATASSIALAHSRTAHRQYDIESKLFLRFTIVNLILKRYYIAMTERETAELLLKVGRLVQAEGYDGELSPAQWMALRYFARANHFSCNPSAFAEFQATTRGTASQAIKSLERSGYLVRRQSKVDKRSVNVLLTRKGKRALARDPFEALVHAVGSLDAREQASLQHALRRLLSAPALSGEYQQFGTCQDCAHVGGEACCKQGQAKSPGLECLLLGIPIDLDESDRICVHFTPRDGDAVSPVS